MTDELGPDIETQGGRERIYTPAYVPIQSLLSFLETIDPEAIPRRVDRGMMLSYSGGVQKKLMSALTFLGLIRPGGETTELFNELVTARSNEDAFKASLAKILDAAYA